MTAEESVRLRDKYTKKTRPIFGRAVWRHFEKMLTAAEENHFQYLSSVITRVEITDLTDAFIEVYKKVGIKEAFREFDLLTGNNKARRYAGEIEVLAGWTAELEGIVLDELIPAIGAVLTTSQEIFIKTVNEWLLTEGGNLQNVADALRAKFRTLQPWRAWNIARTETLSAMNYGSELGARQTGYEFNKTWLQVQRKGMRDVHTYLHGQTIPNNQLFLSGSGALLRFPGDPKAPAGDRVNCRCTIIREVI
jgi:hypothetical protein